MPAKRTLNQVGTEGCWEKLAARSVLMLHRHWAIYSGWRPNKHQHSSAGSGGGEGGGGDVPGISTLTPVREDERCHQCTEARPAPETPRYHIQIAFSFHPLKPQSGAGGPGTFYWSRRGSPQVIKVSNPFLLLGTVSWWLRLFLQAVLPQVASEVMFGKWAVEAVL